MRSEGWMDERCDGSSSFLGLVWVEGGGWYLSHEDEKYLLTLVWAFGCRANFRPDPSKICSGSMFRATRSVLGILLCDTGMELQNCLGAMGQLFDQSK